MDEFAVGFAAEVIQPIGSISALVIGPVAQCIGVGDHKVGQIIPAHWLPTLFQIDQRSEGRTDQPGHQLIDNPDQTALQQQLAVAALINTGDRPIQNPAGNDMGEGTIEILP